MNSLLFSPFEHLIEVLPQIDAAQSDTRIFNLKDSARALLITLVMHRHRSYHHLLLTGTDDEAEVLGKDIQFYQELLKGISPSYDLLTTPLLLPEQNGIDSTGIRLGSILEFKKGRLLAGSTGAFLSPTWEPEELSLSTLKLGKGATTGREELSNRLRSLGYRQVSLISEKGQMSKRGWVFDIYPSNMDKPVRLEFFGDEVDVIKTFEIDTQRSDSQLDEVEILPAIEKRDGNPLIGSFEEETFCFYSEAIWDQVSTFDTQGLAGDREGVPLSLCQILRPDPATVPMKGIGLYSLPMDGETEAPALPISGLGLLHDERKDIYEIAPALAKLKEMVLFVLSSETQAQRIKEVLKDGGVIAPVVPLKDLGSYSGRFAITVGVLSKGLHIQGLLILTERELFGRRPLFKPHKASRVRKLLERIEDLKAGDYVVHRDHGIGRFSGLEHLRSSAYEGDAMVIEYAEGARLYLPLQSIGLVQKYRAAEGFTPPVDRMGGSRWRKKRDRARKKIRELAHNLISLYAQREIVEGCSFSTDTELHKEFEAFFPYEETPDQAAAWNEIKRDMESSRPMDRLLCGDVGYGKTEVAMRAAFKAIYDGKQVAVLVPTTILCEQHYRNFQARFSAFPVKIDFLSRFKSTAGTKRTIAALKQGDVDIIIATHALLSKKVRFYDLGLLIIDEEHRFGVTHKERIKELKRKVDCLIMSATPIPRTLEMSLSGIREMSLIETPPEERLAIRSVVTTFDGPVIREAVQRELDRKGQVFFVHNRVKDIYKMGDYLRGLVPRARLAIAHGQMRGQELEDVMIRFMDGGIDLLLSTAIIGSGIDIPEANTIIINRADRMGLADLYQLKGRVGRSNVRAYAYFLVPSPDTLTEDARRRIEAIQELSYLGAGLRLAMKDLEIRGSGDLLGAEQSGHIHAVGFEMYMEMLQEEVAALKGIRVEKEIEPSIGLGLSAYIPGDYIEDMTVRLSMYRRLSLCHSDEEVDVLGEEMRDRFGSLPEQVWTLLDLIKLKILAKRLRVLSVSSRNGTVSVIFSPDTPVNVEDLLRHEKDYRGRFSFHEKGFSIKGDHDSKEGLLRDLKDLFSQLKI